MPIRITPVESARDVRQFIELPHRIYAGDPYWVAPLHNEIRKLLSRKKNPFFLHSDAALWLAWHDGELVGRISAQINRLHLERYRDATGNFGFLEAFDDQAVFDALLATAENWLRARGMRRAVGPYSLTINDDIGVLISGFDMPPSALMGHSPPYYGARLEAAGYRKAKDLYAYRLDIGEIKPEVRERMRRIAERFNPDGRITLRRLDLKRFEQEMRLVLDIYNDAWQDNWGFLPVTDEEARVLVAAIKPIIRPEQIVIAEMDGRTVGVIASIPNINEIIADLNGRLLPFGWAKFLWRMRMSPPKSVRVTLAGTLYELRDSPLSGGITTLLLEALVDTYFATGITGIECSWILEDNKGSIGITRLFGKIAKTYRVYERDLAPAEAALQDASSLRHSSAAI
ncbi:MAG TPA: dATP pyrophosphohydrolase [Stellaceae bacterium]|nr:dATP pyrophosphohydrolase [Stellaceae bacterium]